MREPVEVEIDTTVPNAARVYDYLLGGDANFAVDREVAERNNAALPGGIATARAEIRANRDFLIRAVRHLAEVAGVRQFLDIGTGIPNDDHVHAIAQEVAADSRIVYVDYDPVVLAHASQLLTGTPEGATAYIHGDLRKPDAILEQAAETLDFDEPVALVLVGLLYLIGDDDQPHDIVRRLVDALPSGSYLVVSHMTQDINPEAMAELSKRLNESMKEPFVMRTHEQVSRFFDGLDLVDPGVVQVNDWRPASGAATATEGFAAYYVGVGRKP